MGAGASIEDHSELNDLQKYAEAHSEHLEGKTPEELIAEIKMLKAKISSASVKP